MPVAKLTGQGLRAIAFSAALLGICLIGERLMLHRAFAERIRVRHQIEELQRRPIPVVTPMPARRRLPLVTSG